MRKLGAIRQAGAIVHEIVLAPLRGEDLAQLIADFLHCEPERAGSLAQLVHEKTAGNPFLRHSVHTALAEEALIAFDLWRCEMGPGTCLTFRLRVTTDNVADLMAGK